MQIVTPNGRRLTITYINDWTSGATTYHVDRMGAFVLTWYQYAAPDDHNTLVVHYGTGPHQDWRFYAPRDQAPNLFGTTLVAYSVINPDKMTDGSHWLHAQRSIAEARAEEISDASRRHLADILRGLVDHWRNQPWHLDLHRAHRHQRAPTHLRDHNTKIRELTAEADRIAHQLAEQRAAARIQADLIAAGPVTPPADTAPALIVRNHHHTQDHAIGQYALDLDPT
ncbi:hypothetical protein [Embleya sp. NPDC059237]|uniref:hypothetical protein n=1 Tax=Embleya sp. NPDC059237 TaxID=3346784 RepID=UPI0036BE082F